VGHGERSEVECARRAKPCQIVERAHPADDPVRDGGIVPNRRLQPLESGALRQLQRAGKTSRAGDARRYRNGAAGGIASRGNRSRYGTTCVAAMRKHAVPSDALSTTLALGTRASGVRFAFATGRRFGGRPWS